MIALHLPILAASAEQPDAPFTWSARVDGVERPLGPNGRMAVGLPGWTCTLAVDPVERTDDATTQAGELGCEAKDGARVTTPILCRTHVRHPKDSGAGNLILARDDTSVAIEASCRSPGHPERPPLKLDDRPGASHVGVPPVRPRRTPGTFRWALAADAGPLEIEAPGPLAQPDDRWACEQEIYARQDESWGYAEVGTITCRHDGTRVTTSLPCVRGPDEPPACFTTALTASSRDRRSAPLLLQCESVGNPGCF